MKKILKSLIILALTLAAVLSLTSCFGNKPDSPDTGERLTGTYEWSLGPNAGSSTYTFDGDRVVNEYYVGGELVVLEYTYVISVEGGVETICLTDITTGRTAKYDFAKGNGYIEISGETYNLVD